MTLATPCARGSGAGVIDLPAGQLAILAEGELAAGDPERAGPERAVIDSREVGPGTCSWA